MEGTVGTVEVTMEAMVEAMMEATVVGVEGTVEAVAGVERRRGRWWRRRLKLSNICFSKLYIYLPISFIKII